MKTFKVTILSLVAAFLTVPQASADHVTPHTQAIETLCNEGLRYSQEPGVNLNQVKKNCVADVTSSFDRGIEWWQIVQDTCNRYAVQANGYCRQIGLSMEVSGRQIDPTLRNLCLKIGDAIPEGLYAEGHYSRCLDLAISISAKQLTKAAGVVEFCEKASEKIRDVSALTCYERAESFFSHMSKCEYYPENKEKALQCLRQLMQDFSTQESRDLEELGHPQDQKVAY